MLILPLGIKARCLGMPIATLVLATATLYHSVWGFSALEEYEESATSHHTLQNYLTTYWEMLAQHCPLLKKINAKSCQIIVNKTQPDHLLNEKTFFNKISPFLNKSEAQKTIDFVFAEQYWTQKALLNISSSKKDLSLTKFHEAQEAYKQKIIKLQKKFGLVSFASMDWKSLFQAQFLHGGWIHLFGNMLFLFMVARAVEERLGFFRFIILYFLGGLGGLYTHLYLHPNDLSLIIGASANVSAIAGGFLILFWSKKTKLWLSFFGFFGRIIYVSTPIFFLGYLVLKDIVGAIANQSQVAHIAHLAGFALGSILAFSLDSFRIEPLQKDMAYPYEAELFKKLQAAKNPKQQQKIIKYWLECNPENSFAIHKNTELLTTQNVG